MGGIQQRKCEVWVTIQRNLKTTQKQLFDFTKQRALINSSKVFFPSFLHYYQQSKTVAYSLMEDSQNQFVALDYAGNFSNQLHFTKLKKNTKDKVWKLLREEQEILLEQGDFIKLGRIELQVEELKFANSKKSIKNLLVEFDIENKINSNPNPNQLSIYSSKYLKNSEIYSRQALSRLKESDIFSNVPSDCNMKKSIFTQKSSNEVICRFCFEGSSTKGNPLFNVCLCAGSVKNIHFQCLKGWIKNKMGKVETSHCIYYHYEPLICQLCKQHIRSEVIHEGRKYKLLESQKMYPPYMKLKHFQDSKVFQILIRLQQGSKIQIGRGSENQLNLNDPSISRSHCSLYYTSHKLFLKGKKSKYGTFIQLSKSMQLQENQPIQLLIQNNLISIDSKTSSNSFFDQQCCNIQNTFKLVVK